MAAQVNIIICGGGIIGSSIAYYLALRNQKCVIIEQTSIGCAASGKAGTVLHSTDTFSASQYIYTHAVLLFLLQVVFWHLIGAMDHL